METAFSILRQKVSMTPSTYTCTILASLSANPNQLIFLFMLVKMLMLLSKLYHEKNRFYTLLFLLKMLTGSNATLSSLIKNGRSEDMYFQLLTEHITMEIPGTTVLTPP